MLEKQVALKRKSWSSMLHSVNWQQASNITGYKKSKHGRSSGSLLKTVSKKLWRNFTKMSFNIKNVPSSKVNDIIERFRQSGDISVYKGHN